MKSYTNIEESKKLAEILSVESADMHYCFNFDLAMNNWWRTIPNVTNKDNHFELYPHDIPCWSLAALLDQLEDVICDEDGNEWELVIKKEGVQYDLYYLTVYGEQENIELNRFYDDLIDCCYEMILKLKEKDLL